MRKAAMHVAAVAVAISFLHGAALAGPPQAGRSLPERFVPGALDGVPVLADHPVDGTTWAAWAYRDGGEYAIAISVRGADGAWSEPTWIGRDDGLDQIDPDLAFDPSGTAYLAFAVRETGEVRLSLRIAGTAKWSAPFRLSAEAEAAAAPAVRIVGDRFVVAYGTAAGTRIVDFALVPGSDRNRTTGVQEGPDVIDPLGREMDDADGRSGEEAGTSEGTAWRGPRRGTDEGVDVRRAGPRGATGGTR